MRSLTSIKRASFLTLLAIGFASMAPAMAQDNARLAELADDEGCDFSELPSIPNPEDATMDQMVATQGAIQEYMTASTELLECLEGIIDNEDLSEEDRELAIGGYNSEVDNQEVLAENWSTARTRFLELQQQ